MSDAKQLPEREHRMMEQLERWQRQPGNTGKGARPLDLGGHNGSHHSYTLNRLVKRELVSRHPRSPWASRGAYRYKLTEAGWRYLDMMSKLKA